jgi:IclR family KDG regulon transcriptional repressor
MDKTLLKGLTVLEALVDNERPCGVTSLATQLHMSKSSVHRILQTLVSRQFARQDPESQHYLPTLRMWEYGTRVLARIDFKRVAAAQLELLSRQTSETVHLSILDGQEVVYVDKVDGMLPIRAYSEIGGRAPAYCVATGKALLAYQPETVLEQFGPTLKQFSPRTLHDVPSLRNELKRVRKLGYAVNRGEWSEGVWGVAAPIFDGTGRVTAALGLSGPAQRMRPPRIREYAALLIDASEAVSRDLR